MNNLLKTLSLAVLLGSVTSSLQAVAFDSGSNGSDGALDFAPDQDWVVFNPDDYDPVLDEDGDGIYHFTTITVGSGTYVRLGADVLGHKPLIWLASGDVVLDGELHFNGYDGVGVGGFAGGKIGGPIDGQGPSGSLWDSAEAAFPDEGHVNPFLIPLIGGSGQGASSSEDGLAGGGAMLLASSGTVTWEGRATGGGSAGGNIRLIANRLLGGGSFYEFNVIRIEAYEINFSGNLNANTVVKTRPGAVFPTHPIKITVIDSLPVDQTKPGANKDAPDVTINNGNEVVIKVECTGIPLDSTIEVMGWNDTVGKVSQEIINGLTGTLEASEATCTMVIPTGNTTFMARAVML